MRIFLNAGFFLGMGLMIFFAVLAIFDASYGIYLCHAHGWFDRECNDYVFTYADLNLLKMGVTMIVWMFFNFAR